MTTGIYSRHGFTMFFGGYEAIADGIHYIWNPLISKRKTGGMHQINFCKLSQGRRNWGGAVRHSKKRDAAKIVKSDVCNGLFPAITSDICPCECCACLDPPLTRTLSIPRRFWFCREIKRIGLWSKEKVI